MRDEGTTSYHVEGHLATITLDRPGSLNSFTMKMARELAAATTAAQDDNEVLAVIVTGAGDRAFCAGGDLGEVVALMSQGHSDRLMPDPEKRFFSGLFKPVIAAVHGHCLGGGLEIMLGSDMRIASPSATFGLTETRWGSIPGGGSHIRLPGQIPYAVAMQMLLTGEPIDAERAREVGLVNEVVPSSDVLNRAREIAEMISRGAPLAVQTAKRIAVYARSEQRGFALEHALGESVLRSEDCREGPRAFAEGRAPVFRGR